MKFVDRKLKNSSDSNVVYLPLEVCRRELVGKVFLATRLAKDGHSVVLFQSDFFDKFGWPEKGFYIGKNCFRTERPYDTKFYNRMKSHGVSLWHLDEEGGIYAGQGIEDWAKRIQMRLDPQTLDSKDKILCWGKWQKETFEKDNPTAEVLITGSPNFDIFDPRYVEAFDEYDYQQTKGETDFILVNTRFSLTNGFVPLADHLMGKGPTSKLLDRKHFSETAITMGALQYLVSKLIFDLANTYPQQKFVVRPHPAENPNFYLSLFSTLDNVRVHWSGDVGSWIRRSDALIHNGCTTSLQAAIARKPVITFMPLLEPAKSEFKLPNTVGEICRSVDEVVSALGRLDSLMSSDYSFTDTIDGTESIERISVLVNSVVMPTQSGKTSVNLLKSISKKHTANIARRLLRKYLSHLSPKIGKRIEDEAKRFDFDFFSNAPRLHSIANRYYNTNSTCINFKDSCCVICPSAELSR